MKLEKCPDCGLTENDNPTGIPGRHQCKQIQTVRDTLAGHVDAPTAQHLAETVCDNITREWSRAWTDKSTDLAFMAQHRHWIVNEFASEIDQPFKAAAKMAFDTGFKYAFEMLTLQEVRSRAKSVNARLTSTVTPILIATKEYADSLPIGTIARRNSTMSTMWEDRKFQEVAIKSEDGWITTTDGPDGSGDVVVGWEEMPYFDLAAVETSEL